MRSSLGSSHKGQGVSYWLAVHTKAKYVKPLNFFFLFYSSLCSHLFIRTKHPLCLLTSFMGFLFFEFPFAGLFVFVCGWLAYIRQVAFTWHIHVYRPFFSSSANRAQIRPLLKKNKKKLWDFSDSNQGPIDLQSNALPAAPKSHRHFLIRGLSLNISN